MWRKNEGHAPHGPVVAVRFFNGETFTTGPSTTWDWSLTSDHRADDLADYEIREYDDGQEPGGQGDGFGFDVVGPQPVVRTFATGATRHSDTDKYDYEGFLSPVVLEAYGAYMHVNRRTADGGQRASDNWQKGIPLDAYMKSKWRHDIELWKAHRGHSSEEGELAAACGVLFNTMGWIHERAKADPEWFARELDKFKRYRAAEIASRGEENQ